MSTFGKIGARDILWHPGWWGFYIQSVADGTTVYMTKTGSPPAVSLEYSIDGGHVWLPFDADEGSTVISLNAGEKAHFRGTNNRLASGASAYHAFGGTGEFNIGGNIMSLLDGTIEKTSVTGFSSYTFARLFAGCASIRNASKLVTPENLTQQCFNGTFYSSGLIIAPNLTAKNINQACYSEMFAFCTSLDSVQQILPAKTVYRASYYYMFRNCKFKVAPHISAITFVSANNVFDGMFNGCSNLNEVSIEFSTWPPANNWMQNVNSGGIFRCPSALGTNETIERGASRCPSNWTVVNI